MSGYHLIAIGFVLLLTPFGLLIRDIWHSLGKGENEVDVENWIFSKTFEQIISINLMMTTGVWLIGTGALYLTLPV